MLIEIHTQRSLLYEAETVSLKAAVQLVTLTNKACKIDWHECFIHKVGEVMYIYPQIEQWPLDSLKKVIRQMKSPHFTSVRITGGRKLVKTKK